MEQQERTFSKKVGDRTLTRVVVSASDEVAAKFEGFVEDKPGSSGAAKAAKAAGGSGAAANNAG